MPGDIVDDAIAAAEIHTEAVDHERKMSATSASPDAHSEKHHLTGLEDFPTEEEMHTLRRVADYIPLKLFTIAFIELCERFSYYGTIVVVCSSSPFHFVAHLKA